MKAFSRAMRDEIKLHLPAIDGQVIAPQHLRHASIAQRGYHMQNPHLIHRRLYLSWCVTLSENPSRHAAHHGPSRYGFEYNGIRRHNRIIPDYNRADDNGTGINCHPVAYDRDGRRSRTQPAAVATNRHMLVNFAIRADTHLPVDDDPEPIVRKLRTVPKISCKWQITCIYEADIFSYQIRQQRNASLMQPAHHFVQAV
jgi:hypothetical protein